MNWKKYFEMMIDWKKLPAYRTEPRIDSFIGFYLPAIATDFLNDQIIGIIPELPIRLGTVNPKHENKNYADKSYKVDFYLLGKSRINYFAEFKTDSKSRREAQDGYLKEARNIGMKEIVEGIKKIETVSSYKEKYNHLIDKLIELGLLDHDNVFNGLDEIKILYIQPNNKFHDEFCIDFQWIYDWFKSRKDNDEFEEYFISALKKWSTD